jgi:hypothetical protein
MQGKTTLLLDPSLLASLARNHGLKQKTHYWRLLHQAITLLTLCNANATSFFILIFIHWKKLDQKEQDRETN